MDRRSLLTKNGHDFYVVSSLLQKSLRRGDVVLAASACAELLPKYANYCWNRLLTVSAEDCHGLVTQEIVALYQAWKKVTGNSTSKKSGLPPGHVFFAKAIVLLAQCQHSRDADELLHLIVNRIPTDEFERGLHAVEEVLDADAGDFDIPEWVLDVHTREGRRAGKTRADFVREEHDALTNASTMFGNFDEMASSDSYVQPEFEWPS